MFESLLLVPVERVLVLLPLRVPVLLVPDVREPLPERVDVDVPLAGVRRVVVVPLEAVTADFTEALKKVCKRCKGKARLYVDVLDRDLRSDVEFFSRTIFRKAA